MSIKGAPASIWTSRWHSLRSRVGSVVTARSPRRELVVYAGLYAGSAGLLKLIGFVLFLWMARTLSVSEYASFGLAYALQSGLAMITLAGIVEAVVGRLNEHPTAEGRYRLFASANTTFVVMAGPVVTSALTLYLAFIGSSANDWSTLAYVVVSGTLLAFVALQAQIVRLQEDHLAAMCFSFVVPMSGFVAGYAMFTVRPGVESFFVGTTVGTVMTLAVLRVVGIGFYGFDRRLAGARSILLGLGPFFAIAVLGWLGGYGNTFVVEYLFDPAHVAGFSFVLMISSIMQLVATALNQVWSPRFFRLVHELPTEVVERANRQFFRWQGLALGLAGGALLVVFPVAMRLLGGNLVAYQSMRLELCFLVVAYVILSPWWHCYNYYLVHGQGVEAMHITVATSAIGIAVWVALMWVLGPLGIYVGFLTQMLVRMLAIVVCAKRRWPMAIAWEGVAAGLLLVVSGYAISAL